MNARSKKVGILIAAALVLGLGIFAYVRLHDWSDDASEIRVGALLPLTGDLAFLGEPERNALLLARDEIKEGRLAGDVKLQLDIEDSRGNPRDAVTIAQRLVSGGRPVVITTATLVCIPTQPVFKDNQVVQLAVSMHPRIAEMSPWTFRVFPSGWLEADLLLKRLEAQRPGKVALFYGKVPEMEVEATEFLMPGLERLGIDVVLSESYDIREKSFRNLVLKAKTAEATDLVVLGFGFNFPPILREARAQGFAGDHIFGGLGLLELSGSEHAALVEGVTFVGPRFAVDGGSPAWQAFERKYRERFGSPPTYDAGFAYDMLHMVARVVRERGGDADAIRQGLLGLRAFPGVTGEISITENGDAHVDLALAAYRDGKPVLVEGR